MPATIDWERWIGRRFRLKDLHIFFTVAELGSMAKAARRIGMSQPAVSTVIADLEHTLGVRLFDRGGRGVELTTYGRTLLRRSNAAFDELKQGVMDIGFLADPSSGELRLGCSQSIAAANLPPILHSFSERFPRVTLSVIDVPPPILDPTALQDRRCEVVLGRVEGSPDASKFPKDVNAEPLYEDRLVAAASRKSPWAHRRKIDLAELKDAKWILTSKNTFNHECVVEAFRSRGLALPTIIMTAQSTPLRNYFLTHGDYIATFASSVLRFNADQFGLKELPVKLTDRKSFVGMITLKNRMLSPVAERFIQHAREFTGSMR